MAPNKNCKCLRGSLIIMVFLVISIMANNMMVMGTPYTITHLQQTTNASKEFIMSQSPIYHATPGVDDIHDREFTLAPQSNPEDFELEYTYEAFTTDGHDICVYGEFNLYRSDLWVEFFFIDDVGFEEYIALEVTDRKHEHIDNKYVSHEWNEILPSFYMGEYVSTWYVVLSVVYAPYTEPIREGNLFVGKDRMAPTVNIDFPTLVNGSASAIISVEELNCNLDKIKVWVDSDLYHEESLSGNQYTRTVPIDSTEYQDGIYKLRVYVSDTGGAWRTVEHPFTIKNTPDAPIISPYNWTNIIQNIYQNFESPFGLFSLLLNLIATSISMVKVKRKSQRAVTWFDWVFILGWIFFFVYLMFGGLWQILSIIVSSFLVLLSFTEEFVEWRVN